MPDLPPRPSLEHLRKQAKSRKRERGIALSQAQHELASEYGFDSWPKLVHHVQASRLDGIERALVLADTAALARLLHADPTAATAAVEGLAPLLVLLRRSIGPPADVRTCARLLLDAGAHPDSHTVEWGGGGRRTALFDAVERGDLQLAERLVERGATRDEDAFYHACEQADTAFLDLLYQPGEDGPTPLDCALWGLQSHRAEDGDYPGTVQALLAADAVTSVGQPGDQAGVRRCGRRTDRR